MRAYTKGIVAVLLFSFVHFIQSCNSDNNKWGSSKDVIEKSESIIKSNSKELIKYTDSILKNNSGLNKPSLIKLYELRQQAFSNLRIMDSVLSTGEQIRSIASQIPDSLAIAQSLLLVKGDIEFKEQKKLLIYLPSAIQTFSKYKMPFEEARLHANYGAILVQSGDFKLAQSHLLKAYDMMERMDSVKHLINISTYIGNNYQRMRSNDLALKYYNKALSLAKQSKDTLTQVSVLMNMGIFFSYLEGSTDSAIIYYQQAKALFPKTGPYYLGMKLDYNMAIESFMRKKYVEAEAIFNEMIAKCVQLNLTEGQAHALNGLSSVYAESNKLNLAVQTGKRAFKLFDSLGLKYDALDQAENLVEITAKTGNSQVIIKAIAFAKKLKDSLMSVEKQSAVHELETKYQTEKKEQEIVLLKKNASYRQNIIIVLAFAVCVFFFLYRKIKRTNYELNISQQVLVDQYRLDKELRDAERADDKAKLELLTAKTNSTISSIADDEKIQSPIQKLTNYFNEEKPFLDPKLKQEDILIRLDTNAKALLKLLKEHGYENFNAFLNYYRVNEAKLLIEMPENNNLKMEAIANKAGFGTRQSFYNAFETNTGLTPAFYRSKVLGIPE